MSPTFPAVTDFAHLHHTNYTSRPSDYQLSSPIVSSCCNHHMELSSFGCTIIPVFIDLPSAFLDIFPANHFLVYDYNTVFLYFCTLSWTLKSQLAITSHVKNSD